MKNREAFKKCKQVEIAGTKIIQRVSKEVKNKGAITLTISPLSPKSQLRK